MSACSVSSGFVSTADGSLDAGKIVINSQISVLNLTEGNQTSLVFVFNQAATTNSTISWKLTGIGTDFPVTSGTVIVAAGDSSESINLSSVADGLYSLPRTYDLTIEGDPAVFATSISLQAIVVDNTPSTSVSIADSANVIEGTNASFTVSLSSPSSDVVTIHYASSDGTALSGTNYSSATGTLTFNPGQTSKTITVPTIDAGSYFAVAKTMSITLSSVTQAKVAASVATGRITSAHAAPLFAVTVNNGSSQMANVNFLPIDFDIVFSEAINSATFTTSDVAQSGTASGISWTLLDSGNHINFILRVTAISTEGTLIPSLPASQILSAGSTLNQVSTSTLNIVAYDITYPTQPGVMSYAATAPSITYSPQLSWGASVDAGSGVANYQVAIGTSAGLSDVQTWTSVGNLTTYLVGGLSLINGSSYYASVRAIDAAGNTGSVRTGSAWTAAYCPPGRQVFSFTGANQTYTPNSNCTSVFAKLWGAGGGGSNAGTATNFSGGGGGSTFAFLSVSSANTYTVIVGGGGGSAVSVPAAGGFGGGAVGNSMGGWSTGGGGGRSAVQLTGTELITAGGGGGGGCGTTGAVRTGGGGGGTIGSAGLGSATAGAGGTQSAGGSAGVGAGNGNSGSQFLGGNGNASYGGGGGGGYYGGGGGGYNNSDVAAGGGGSSYVSGSGVSLAVTTNGSNNLAGNSSDVDFTTGSGGTLGAGGNGKIVIYYGAQITSIMPVSGTTEGGTSVTVYGIGLVSGTTVSIGGNPCTGVSIISSNQLSCTYPAGIAGAVSVVATIPGYNSSTLASAFTYVAAIATSQTFPYTGSLQTWSPPAGYSTMMVKIWGAGGGGTSTSGYFSSSGGAGGYTLASAAITSGTAYSVLVGGGGGPSVQAGPGAGGFGGGGEGHVTGTGFGGGGGGGRSSLRLASVDLITAGGGGGAGTSGNQAPRTGGAGGGLVAAPAGSTGIMNGQGGTQSAGGAAGVGMVQSGTAGTQYIGGNGSANYGGGGGGGWYGGGGGGYSNGDVSGGGGGSSYAGGSGVTGFLNIAGSFTTAGFSTNFDNGNTGSGGAVAGTGGNGRIKIYYGSQAVDIFPNQGIIAGGGTVTIYGLGFVAGTTVLIGGNPCTSVSISNVNQLSCTFPSGTLGAANVAVTIPSLGTSTLTSAFTYVANSGTQMFSSVGTYLTWSPPAGVSTITVKLWGAGGAGAGSSQSGIVGFSGGGGGYTTATMAVSASNIYSLIVGGGGLQQVTSVTGFSPGGFGGGGLGHYNTGSVYGSGSGGGRSAIQLNGTDLITAAGGGGGGASGLGNTRSGGGGGGTSGSNAGGSGIGGGGGTSVAGGIASTGNLGDGVSGTLGTGGDGNSSYGAGGGGGYYGGAGGSYNNNDVGGGGGGSSYFGGVGVSGGSSIGATGATQGNSGDTDNGGAGAGGNNATIGTAGKIIISW